MAESVSKMSRLGSITKSVSDIIHLRNTKHLLTCKKVKRCQSQVAQILHISYLFTKSDLSTFIIPAVLFGSISALSGAPLVNYAHFSALSVLARLPLSLLFNWSNILVFDLANQRLPESVKEDSINKPSRPIVAGKISADQTRRALLLAVPIVFALNVMMGVSQESMLIQILTYLYNDLKGCDEISRDLITALGFFVHNHGSLRIAMGPYAEITPLGYIWIAMISGVILTTMSTSDLKDQEGDRTRGRWTVPLFFGDAVCRWMVSTAILVWSIVCLAFWSSGMITSSVFVGFATYIAYRFLCMRDVKADTKSWKLWCLWLSALYFLPLIHQCEGMF